MSNKFIYKCSWFESKRHRISHTDMFYEHAEHTQWIFTSEAWFKDLVRVEYIQVAANAHIYKLAVETSNIAAWADKQKQLMEDFERFRKRECVVCYETKNCWDIGYKCGTCKNAMCIKCSWAYAYANVGKFPASYDEKTDTKITLMPCPMCRTENLFEY